jgi:hypothetical protein
MSFDPNELFFELKLVDGTGRVHGVVRRPIDRKAAFMGTENQYAGPNHAISRQCDELYHA